MNADHLLAQYNRIAEAHCIFHAKVTTYAISGSQYNVVLYSSSTQVALSIWITG